MDTRRVHETLMGAPRRFVHRLILGVAATFTALVTFATAGAQDQTFSPGLSGAGSRQFEQTQSTEKSASTIKQDDEWTKWMKLPQVPHVGSYWDSFDADFTRNIGGDGFKESRDPASTSKPANSNDTFSFGKSHLGIQTEKDLKSPWRTDCASDDECADYSGLPKSEPSKRTLKNLRKPFFGLSVTTPLQ
jgi:hypothetical protein